MTPAPSAGLLLTEYNALQSQVLGKDCRMWLERPNSRSPCQPTEWSQARGMEGACWIRSPLHSGWGWRLPVLGANIASGLCSYPLPPAPSSLHPGSNLENILPFICHVFAFPWDMFSKCSICSEARGHKLHLPALGRGVGHDRGTFFHTTIQLQLGTKI